MRGLLARRLGRLVCRRPAPESGSPAPAPVPLPFAALAPGLETKATRSASRAAPAVAARSAAAPAPLGPPDGRSAARRSWSEWAVGRLADRERPARRSTPGGYPEQRASRVASGLASASLHRAQPLVQSSHSGEGRRHRLAKVERLALRCLTHDTLPDLGALGVLRHDAGPATFAMALALVPPRLGREFVEHVVDVSARVGDLGLQALVGERGNRRAQAGHEATGLRGVGALALRTDAEVRVVLRLVALVELLEQGEVVQLVLRILLLAHLGVGERGLLGKLGVLAGRGDVGAASRAERAGEHALCGHLVLQRGLLAQAGPGGAQRGGLVRSVAVRERSVSAAGHSSLGLLRGERLPHLALRCELTCALLLAAGDALELADLLKLALPEAVIAELQLRAHALLRLPLRRPLHALVEQVHPLLVVLELRRGRLGSDRELPGIQDALQVGVDSEEPAAAARLKVVESHERSPTRSEQRLA